MTADATERTHYDRRPNRRRNTVVSTISHQPVASTVHHEPVVSTVRHQPVVSTSRHQPVAATAPPLPATPARLADTVQSAPDVW